MLPKVSTAVTRHLVQPALQTKLNANYSLTRKTKFPCKVASTACCSVVGLLLIDSDFVAVSLRSVVICCDSWYALVVCRDLFDCTNTTLERATVNPHLLGTAGGNIVRYDFTGSSTPRGTTQKGEKKTSAASTTDWKFETQLCKLRATSETLKKSQGLSWAVCLGRAGPGRSESCDGPGWTVPRL